MFFCPRFRLICCHGRASELRTATPYLRANKPAATIKQILAGMRIARYRFHCQHCEWHTHNQVGPFARSDGLRAVPIAARVQQRAADAMRDERNGLLAASHRGRGGAGGRVSVKVEIAICRIHWIE